MKAIASLSLVALVLITACPGDSGLFTDGAGPGPDQFVIPDRGDNDITVVYACDTVDILFVIDNSNSMGQEQKNLIANFPKFIARIEGIKPAIKSYHVGVISTDLGAGPYTIGKACSPPGDEGKLQHTPSGAAGCAGTYPKFLQGPGADVAKRFGCIAELGLGGCGYEQQMEAAHRALSSQAYNAGFLRANAPLAIIFITDEDDCSAKDARVFDPDAVKLGDQQTRCERLSNMLFPVSRYVAAFKALKSRPDRVVVAAITGPPGTVVFDSTIPGGVKPACSSTALGGAKPGNRFSELVKGFGDRGVQRSLCEGDLAQALDVIGAAIERVCLK